MSQTTITPHDQSPYVTRELTKDYDSIVQKGSKAQKSWAKVPIERRIEIGTRFVVRVWKCCLYPQSHSQLVYCSRRTNLGSSLMRFFPNLHCRWGGWSTLIPDFSSFILFHQTPLTECGRDQRYHPKGKFYDFYCPHISRGRRIKGIR